MIRKILVPIDIKNPQKRINDYLFPDHASDKTILRRIKTGKECEYGLVVLTSEIDENFIFQKIVDGGHKIESVDKTMSLLKEYVKELPKFKIGNILILNDTSPNLDFIVKFPSLTQENKNFP
jgi:hypothetical protein